MIIDHECDEHTKRLSCIPVENRSLSFSLGRDHFGVGVSRLFGLPGHGSLQLHRQAHIFDLDLLDLDAKTKTHRIKHDLHGGCNFLAVG